jgi:hypothetical protein
MADDQAEIAASPDALEQPQRQLRRVVLLSLLGIVVLALLMAWLTRKQIAESIISNQLAKLELPATYEVEAIGPKQEVLRNLVVGDPQNPDLTAERVIVSVVPRWGMPDLGRITIEKPRIYGSYKQGKLSFGSLDKLLFTGSKEPFRLPELDVAIVDGRGRLDSQFGAVGFQLEGAGALRDGFKGTVAAIMPQLAVAGCKAGRTTLYGNLSIKDEKPAFSGPLRAADLNCPVQGVKLAGADVQIDTVIDPQLDGGEGTLNAAARQIAAKGIKVAASGVKASFTYRKAALTARYTLTGQGIDTPQAQLAKLGSSGVLRAQDQFGRIEVEGDLSGSGARLGGWLDGALASAQTGSAGTFAAPLIGQVRSGLVRELPGSKLSGNFILRQTGSITNLVVPQASVGALLALSRVQLTTGSDGPMRLGGNFSTGGRAMPRLSGRAERGPSGGFTLRATMPDYAAGQARLALPELVLVQGANGGLGFAGLARMSGPLPGGAAQNLALPIEGNWSPDGRLAVWRKCVPVSFDSLTLANLTLQRGQQRGLTLCPAPGAPILASDGRGLRLAAGTGALNVAGKLGSTPIRVTSGPLGFAYPGQVKASGLDVTLGQGNSQSNFRIASLSARVGQDITGRFGGTDVKLAAVPLDLLGTEGDWRYAGGKLSLSNTNFRLEDREVDDLFQPLISNDGELQLADNVITAKATLREPKSLVEVVRTVIRHDLNTSTGSADLLVSELTFDRNLQPDTLSRLALGMIANAYGTWRGTGRIDWNDKAVTSTGRFSTDAFDFAAGRGPVKGLSGTVVFTDLLGLVTAPDQRFRIAQINPGIAVYDGELRYEIRPDRQLAVLGGDWPFLGGTLTLQPTQMQLGSAEAMRFTLQMAGLDAAKFMQQIESGNVSATGVFDGTLPLVFDENGGRIEGGQLISRAPGGNVSYVGQLTYKDMGFMANFAFDALKSLDYQRMQIDLNGALEGELITRVSFNGLSQGNKARRNFITRQISRLPIQFNINMRAPFFKLVTSLRSLYDPNYVPDPRALGLLGSDGKRLQPVPTTPDASVQPPVSEPKP